MEPKKKRASGKGGPHRKALMALRPERDGQAEEWREAAARASMTLAAWVRDALDRAAREGEEQRRMML